MSIIKCICKLWFVQFNCSNGIVTYNHVMELREKLDKMVTTKGLTAEEKGTHFSILAI